MDAAIATGGVLALVLGLDQVTALIALPCTGRSMDESAGIGRWII